MAWNPTQYLKFGSARLRPAIDLVTRTSGVTGDPSKVKTILDLGCGPGNISEILCRSFPNAHIEGVDSSVEMIGRALKDRAKSEFVDRMSYRVGSAEHEAVYASKKYDLVFSNAALHWCTNHDDLFPRIVNRLVNPVGGVLAIQMPDTVEQMSHVLMDTAAFRSGMLDKLRHVRIPRAEHDTAW
jgi:trans-aconitate 2-methyltransferase